MSDKSTVPKIQETKIDRSSIPFIENKSHCINTQLREIIKVNSYVCSCKSNKKKDKASLSYLINIPISQSECIKLGYALEKVLCDIILKYNKSLKNMKQSNSKGKREKDHLFFDKYKKIIYYAELKSNINLDTEKSKATKNKCLTIFEELEEEYPDYEIQWCLVGLRYINNQEIPTTIYDKYKDISDNVYGINDYMEMLSINLKFDEETYKQFLNDIVLGMFKSL